MKESKLAYTCSSRYNKYWHLFLFFLNLILEHHTEKYEIIAVKLHFHWPSRSFLITYVDIYLLDLEIGLDLDSYCESFSCALCNHDLINPNLS